MSRTITFRLSEELDQAWKAASKLTQQSQAAFGQKAVHKYIDQQAPLVCEAELAKKRNLQKVAQTVIDFAESVQGSSQLDLTEGGTE